MAKVELLPAFFWICNECGSDNFERGLVAEMSESEMIDVREELELSEFEEVELIGHPEMVTCKECGTEYKAICQDGECDTGLDDE
jgi:protein-arginine kinase activator protein McsA